jgi:type II secretory pathway component GspD/PulD (secretin)
VQTRQMLHVLALASLGLMLPATSVVAQTQAVRGTSRASDRINDITDVQILTDEAGQTRIVIEGTRAFTPEVSTYKGNTIVAVPGLWRAGRTGVRPVHKNGITFVNCVQFATKPRRIVRVVASSQKELRYELRATDSPRVWEVLLTDADAAAPATPASAEAPVAVEIVPATTGKPIALPPPTATLWTVNGEALWAEADFEPLARTLTPTLAAMDTGQRPVGMLVATPERITPSLLGSGPVAPVVVDLPNPPLDTLPGLTAAAITSSGKPRIAEKPAVKAAEKPKAVSEKPKPETRKRSSEPVDVEKARVTLDLVDTDVYAVLKAIADQSGVNIIVSPEVKGKVTVSLRKVTIADALSQIASISKFEYLLKGQTFFVGSAESINKADSDPELNAIGNEHVSFFYADPQDLKKALDQAFPGLTFQVIVVSSESKLVQTDPSTVGTTGAQTGTPTSQVVKVSPRGGVVAVTASAEKRKKARKFIEDTEKNLIATSVTQAMTDRTRMEGFETEVYKVHNSDPDSLIVLIRQLVPSVQVMPGAIPNFVGTSGGGSASFAAGSAASASAATGAALSGGGGGAAAGPGAVKTNMLVLTGPAADVKRAIEKLEKIDVKVPLLTFEAKLVEVNNDNRDRLGVSYDFSRPVTIGEQNAGDASNIGPGQVGGGAAGGAGGAGGGAAGNPGREFNGGAIFRTPYTINATINALTQQNKARILASPTLTALDNNPAIGFIGDEIKYVSNIQQTPVGQTIQTELARAGITLKVLGRVRPNGEIELLVHPEVSLIKNFLQLPNGVSLPQIATRYVDTTIRVKDGETIAIGGLLNEQDAEAIQKVPFLGDLPILGRFFQNREKNKTRTELMVFITSRIVKD